ARTSAKSSAASTKRSYSASGMTAIRSPFGLVMIAGLFIWLSIQTASRPDRQYVDRREALVENNAPIANAESQSLSTFEHLDVVRKRSRILSILLDLLADPAGVFGPHAK